MQTYPIIEKLGGRERVFAMLSDGEDGQKTLDAIRMWVQRGSIPGAAQRRLMEEADRQGVEYTADDFRVSTAPEQAA